MIDVHTSTMLMIIYTQTQMRPFAVFESLRSIIDVIKFHYVIQYII
jgi:hypothetical protein